MTSSDSQLQVVFMFNSTRQLVEEIRCLLNFNYAAGRQGIESEIHELNQNKKEKNSISNLAPFLGI